jgi:hypothetical protein
MESRGTPGRKLPEEKTSRSPMIWFDDKVGKTSHGYAVHFAQYRLPQAPALVQAVAAAKPSAQNDLERQIADCKKKIAALAGRPESAITISIAL